MAIDRRITRAVADPDTEQLAIRVQAGLGASELLSRIRAAADAFEQAWKSDPPSGGSAPAEPLPPPELIISSAPPDVVITLLKLTDLKEAFDRLIAHLDGALPSGWQLLPVEPSRTPYQWRKPIALLEMRVALRGRKTPFQWELSSEATALVDDAGIAWLRGVGPQAEYGCILPGDRYVRVENDRLLETIQAQRANAPHAHFAAVLGKQFRWLSFWFPSNHVSFIAGTREADTFDWRPYLEMLLEQLHSIEDLTQQAVIHFGTSLGTICASSFVPRKIWLLPSRVDLNPEDERLIEETGLIDAEGLAYVRAPLPAELPQGWSARPFGPLTEIRARDLDAWLAHHPDPATLERARHDLAPLLPPSPKDTRR